MIAPRAACGKGSGDAGFTLLEVLVAMTVLVLLSVALAAGLRYGARLWQASETAANETGRILAAQSALREMLERAYPRFAATTPTDGHVAFDGRADGFDIVTPDAAHPGALLRVAVAAATLGQERVLMATASPELASDAAPARKILLRDVDALEFAYYGRSRAMEQAEWHAEWRYRTVLVRIRVRFAGASARPWPEFVVAPRVTADVKCMFDVLRRNCLGR